MFHSKAATKVTQSLFLSTLFGASLVLLPTLLLTLYFFNTSAHTASSFYDVHEPTLFVTMPARLNATLHANFETPQNARHIHRELESSFSVPSTLSLSIPVKQRYQLLSKLQTTRVGRANKPPHLFILHVVGPSADRRFRAIAAAITYSRNTQRILVVLWDTAHGGEGFGHNALQQNHDRPQNLTSEDPVVIFGHVHSLQLSPNVSHWTDFSMSYFTGASNQAYSLDNIDNLASHHIFYRSTNDVDGKYAAMLPGVMLMPSYIAATSITQREWDAFFKHWTFPQLDDEEVIDVLNRVYAVPKLFLNAMRQRSQRLLLSLLDQSKAKRAFFIHVQYGMGNRLRALGSALAISRVTGRVPVLIWEPDLHLDCQFNDLFVNEFVIIDKLSMEWPPKMSIHSNDDAMKSMDFFNFMRNEGKGRHDPMRNLVNPRAGRHVYVKSAYVIRSSFTPRITSTRSKYWKIMREVLVPKVDIMMVVLDPMFENIDEMVGVHIRARTIENDIKGIGQEEYGASSLTTDHWRRRTGLKTFEDKIRRLSLKYNYFVAADMKETIQELERKFGKHRIFSIPRDGDCVSRDVECAKLALADILLLSKVSTLLGSHWSSFSESAVRFSGTVKLLLAGVHFG